MNRKYWQQALPKLVLSPSLLITLIFVYGFIAYTGFLSFTKSRMLPSGELVGMKNYTRLFKKDNWDIAIDNLLLFGSLYIIICIIIGLFLAILLDQKIRAEGLIRPIFLYPMAISFIVTGTAWKWMLDPSIGLEHIMHTLGWASFQFRWIKDNNLAIYCVVIAAVWQTSGFAMAIFLAGLRGLDNEVLNAAKIDGATGIKIYIRIIIPQLRAAFLSAFIILSHMAIKSYDLVIALTNGGPGNATELPSTFMYSYTFTRNEMGIGASSAIIMLLMISAVIVPYIYSEIREK